MKIIRFMPIGVFLYLTGIGQEYTVLMAREKRRRRGTGNTLYTSAGYAWQSGWTGEGFTPEEAGARSGAAQIASSGEWENRLKLLMRSGRFERIAMVSVPARSGGCRYREYPDGTET